MQFDCLASTRAKFFQALWQVLSHIISIRPQRIGGQDGFQVKTQFCPNHFFTSFHITDMFAKQIACDSQQPRPNQCCGVESGLGKIETQKDLLHHVVGIAGLLQAGTQVAVDGSLMSFDDLSERCAVSAAKLLHQRLIRNIRQNAFPTKEAVRSCERDLSPTIVRSRHSMKQPAVRKQRWFRPGFIAASFFRRGTVRQTCGSPRGLLASGTDGGVRNWLR